MKAIIKLNMLAFLIIIISCSNEANYHNESNNKKELTSIKKEKLSKDSIINGFPCQSWVFYSKKGDLVQFELADSFTISGIRFPPSTVIFLDSNGIMYQVYLAQDQIIQSYQCTGGKLKTATGFYPSGKLRFFFPHQDVNIDGVLCKGGSMSGIWLYESGNLKSAYCAEDIEIEGKTFKKGALIEF